ncbi:MAG: hypothetical protein SGPRY_014990, partial [Prymnesium sp.]
MGGSMADGTEDLAPRGDAIEASLRSAAFKKVANAIAPLDISERMGRFDAISAGFDGACVLTVRALCKPLRSSALTARVSALATLNDLHLYVHEYLSWVLTADPATGNVPRHRQGYSVAGSCDPDGNPVGEGSVFLSKLLNFDLATMDWVFAPGGLLAYKAFADSGAGISGEGTSMIVGGLHPLDIYTVPAMVEELGAFIHKIL